MSTQSGMWVPDTNRPIFDPHLDIATVVFSHVQCFRTRHSLALVSKLWRDASKEVGSGTLTAEDRSMLSLCEIQAEAIVGTGDADMIALARTILYDPRWPWHAAAHLGAKVKAPNQYLRSQPRQYRDLFDV